MKIFKKIVDILDGYVEEHLNFIATTTGIQILVMDGSHVSMVDLFLPKKFFKSYRCKKKAKIGVNIGNLNKVLKRISNSEELETKLDSKGHKLHLESFNNKFSLNLVDIEQEEYPKPEVEYNAKIVMGTPDLFNKGIGNVELFSDFVDFEVNEKEFILSGKGDNGEAATTISEDTESISFEVTEKSNSIYPLSYLTTILPASSITQQLTIEYSSELPVAFTFKLGDDVFLKFWLSPGVEEESEDFEDEEETEEEEENV